MLRGIVTNNNHLIVTMLRSMYIIINLQQVLNLVRRQHPQKYTDHVMELLNKPLQFRVHQKHPFMIMLTLMMTLYHLNNRLIILMSMLSMMLNHQVQALLCHNLIIIHVTHIANNFN